MVSVLGQAQGSKLCRTQGVYTWGCVSAKLVSWSPADPTDPEDPQDGPDKKGMVPSHLSEQFQCPTMPFSFPPELKTDNVHGKSEVCVGGGEVGHQE